MKAEKITRRKNNYRTREFIGMCGGGQVNNRILKFCCCCRVRRRMERSRDDWGLDDGMEVADGWRGLC